MAPQYCMFAMIGWQELLPLAIPVVIWLACGVISSTVAQSKVHSSCLWFGIGIIFGPLGLLIALVMPGAWKGKPCPYCKKWIHRDAVKCPECQSTLDS